MKDKFLICLLVCVSVISAQKVIKIQDALDIALKKSYDIRTASLNLQRSKKSLEAVKLGLNSNIYMEFDLPNYSSQLSSVFNTNTESEEFYQLGSTKMEGRLFISQPIIYTNSQISLVGSFFGRDQFSDTSPTRRDYFSNLSIRLNQPLFQFNEKKASLEEAEINLEQTERNYKQSHRNIVYNVTSAFYRLYQARRRMEITREKVKQDEESFETASNKFKAGLLAEVEALQLEVELASSKNDLLDRERNYEELKRSFSLLIGLEDDENFSIETDLKYEPVYIDEELAIQSAVSKRPDLLNAKDDIYLQELSIERTDARTAFTAELNANYGINKNDNAVENVFNDFLDTRSVVFTLGVPILDWGKNTREVEAAQAVYDIRQSTHDNLRKGIVNEVKSAIGSIKSAEARVKVLERTVEVAQKSYDISIERFKAGKITSFDLTQIQLKLTDSKLNSLAAIIDYKIAIANLERKTMMDIK